jgi:hypothetical protein
VASGEIAMMLNKTEKEAVANRIAPYLTSAADPNTWRLVFLAAMDTGVTFDEAMSIAEEWMANKTADFKALQTSADRTDRH